MDGEDSHRPSRTSPSFSESQNLRRRPHKWVTPTVNVLHTFSETIGHWQSVELVNTKVFRTEVFSRKFFSRWHVVLVGSYFLSVVPFPASATYFDTKGPPLFHQLTGCV